MNLLFVDTSAFYALADRRDPAHDRAGTFLRGCERPLLTTEFVFAETMSLLTKRLGKHVAVQFGDGIRRSARFRIEEIVPDTREAAWALFSTRIDKSFDLIDCISFATMDANGVRDAFAFDKHFAQHGYQLVPSAAG